MLAAAWVVLAALALASRAVGGGTGWAVQTTVIAPTGSLTGTVRVDQVDFGPGAVPAHQINDLRFNFTGADQPVREALPVVVEAQARLSGTGLVRATGAGMSTIRVAGAVVATAGRGETAEARLTGLRDEPVAIAMEPLPLARAALRVETRDLGPATFDLGPALSGGALVLAVMSAVLRARGRRPSPTLWLAFAAGLAAAGPQLVEWWRFRELLFVLPGGDDPLTYESYARDIASGSPLMLLGAPLGEAQPFYFQVFYPYALAAAHLITGESVMGPVLLQILGAGLAVALGVAALPATWTDRLAGAGLLLLSGIAWQWADLAGALQNENLFILLLAVVLFRSSRVRTGISARAAAVLGAAAGLLTLTRAHALLLLPFLGWVVRTAGASRRTLAVFALAAALPLAFTPARNAIAAGSWAPLPTEGGITLYQNNVPAERGAATPGRELQETIAYVVAEPAAFAGHVARKALFVLGFAGATGFESYGRLNASVLVLWLLAPLALLSRHRGSPLLATCLAFVATHVLVLLAFRPDDHYYRLVLPAMLPLALIGAAGVAAVARRLAPARARPARTARPRRPGR